MTASPDRLPRDGRSLSIVTLEVRNAQGQATVGRRVTLGITGGTISDAEVVTGTNGKVQFAVQAPLQEDVVPNNVITVFATPLGDDFNNARTQTLSIALTGVTNSTAPTPSFTVTPAVPEVNQTATFDATATTDEGTQCLSTCSYAWDFGDGATATGRVVTHAFSVAKANTVVLTVTDASGLTATTRQIITPTAPAEPTVTVGSSPNPPVVGQQATFNAIGVAAAGHQIVRYEWDFGDGGTTTTVGGNTTHTYNARGIYTLTVRAIDDLGRAGSTSVQLNLSTGVPQGINATFFASGPTNPGPPSNRTYVFNANESTPSNGATITNYHWIWGDGSNDSEGVTVTHQFPGTGNFQVQLTITDSAGRTAFFRQAAAVQ